MILRLKSDDKSLSMAIDLDKFYPKNTQKKGKTSYPASEQIRRRRNDDRLPEVHRKATGTMEKVPENRQGKLI